MKFLIYLLLILNILFAQTLKTVIDKKTGDPMIVGIGQRSDLTTGHYGVWFAEEYENYEGDEGLMAAAGDLIDNFKIDLFLGTWCEDSRREVPRFYRILDVMNVQLHEMDIIFLDREKKSGFDIEKGKNIHHVPTMIFYRDGLEIGRIIESPVETLEEDIFNILVGDAPFPRYHKWKAKKN